MSLPPERSAERKCYLATNGQVVRVLQLTTDGRVKYEFRSPAVVKPFGWTAAITDLRSFAHLIERPVPCDWTPQTDE